MSLLGWGAVNGQYIKRVNDSTFIVLSDIPAGTITTPQGLKIPVYRTPKGKLYYYKLNEKTGKIGKSYLKPINF